LGGNYSQIESASKAFRSQKITLLAPILHGIFQPGTFKDQQRYGFASEAVKA